jgi:DNA adenine methylase
VRKAAHRYMENFGALGTQHTDIVTGKLKILESYVAPVAFSVGEQKVKKGTWLLGIRAVDDGLWTAIKSGEYTGLSIGGSALRAPESGASAPSS